MAVKPTDVFHQASALAETLNRAPYSTPTIFLSIDDFYIPYHEQKQLAADNPSNPLIQHRGQPSTHDLPLGVAVFSSLREQKETCIPSYDKSAYNGQGDRTSNQKWNTVNSKGEESIEVVIFEGWCVGFRALKAAELQMKWEQTVGQKEKIGYRGKLGFHRLADVEFVNDALRKYDVLTEYEHLETHQRVIYSIDSIASWTCSSTCRSSSPSDRPFAAC